MSTTDPLSWAYHPDFSDHLVTKKSEIALRLLETADIALSFARALVAKEFAKASSLLTADAATSNPADRLRKQFESMIRFEGDDAVWPDYVQVTIATDASDMDDWVGRQPQDFGWAYVAIGRNRYYDEAVAVLVVEQSARLAISEITWGRP